MPSSELRINIPDGKAFVVYLASLVVPTPSQLMCLGVVAESLTRQLYSEYQLKNVSDDRLLELFGSLAVILTQYERLGLGESIRKLGEWFGIARAGYLREYFAASQAQLLEEVGGQHFGPSKWQGDSSPETYRDKYWGGKLCEFSISSRRTQRRRISTDAC